MSEKLTVVDGKQYREVSRKANVGERIKIVQASLTFGDYVNGTVMTVEHIEPNGVRVYPYVDRVNICKFIADYEYVVLEPIEVTDDLRALIDGLTQSFANLTLRVTELDRQVTEILRPIATYKPIKPKPKTRDEIVEQAKKDVVKLSTKYQSSSETPSRRSFWPKECEKDGLFPVHYVEFVVNREKRTVVALIRYLDDKHVIYVGKSRCAPDDCFNAHIGRAIALRRALGLTVPAEYYEAPQPESVRVGDVVRWRNSDSIYRITRISGNKYGLYSFLFGNDSGDWTYDDFNAKYVITDDSREEVGA
ncbi:hypothetical protein [Paenibacillus planticolens]|uniref:Uncharacterized protein n=1 Tax=Paenibacillus planticolens TaxID=2654976 RepID=A0ABX1ZI11_9BACL|nr:hypothetical protein [Paenibacillus planticolens]NOU98461.1 hypothetical protein [Paenibacillus planticolens]